MTPDMEDAISLAHRAEANGLLAEAIDRWRRLVRERPQEPGLVISLVGALKRDRHFEEAQDVLRAARLRFPDRGSIRVEEGWLLAHQGQWHAAIQVWESDREKFPQDASFDAAIAEGLVATKQYAAAESLLIKSIAKYPDDARLAILRPTLSSQQGRWEEAVIGWRSIQDRFPRMEPLAIANLGQALARLGQHASAATMLAEAIGRFPNSLHIAIEFAKLSPPGSEESIVRWRHVAERFSANHSGHLGLAATLRAAGHLDEAETVLESAASRFPKLASVQYEFAASASGRRDWDTAIERWKHVLAIAPSDAARDRMAETRWGAALDKMMEAPPTITRIEAGDADGTAERTPSDIALAFEGLGENCEFGLVQRAFDAEPLGLLRFVGINPDYLLEALKTRFNGVGDPEFTTLSTSGDEYITGDKRYGMAAHTFIKVHASPREKVFADQCRRIGFLRRKLLEDLSNADKIFVYVAYSNKSDEFGYALHKSLQAYGKNKLLLVRAAIANSTPGTVTDQGDGLFFGYLERYGNRGRGLGWSIDTQNWLLVCERTLKAAANQDLLKSPKN